MERAAIAIIFNDKGEVLILERMEPQRDWSGLLGISGWCLERGVKNLGMQQSEKQKKKLILMYGRLRRVRRER